MSTDTSLVLDIDGMTCASCVRRVEKALAKVPGVAQATVNLATNQASLTLSPERPPDNRDPVAPQAIAAVEAAGYEAWVHVEDVVREHHGDEGWKVAAALALSLPLVLPMALMPLGVSSMLPPVWQWALATPVQFIFGARFYRAGWHALRAGSGNMDLLVALGTSAAYGLSLWLWQPWSGGASGDHPAEHSPHLYFEGSAMVISLVMLGKWLEARAKRRTLAALEGLRALRPETATVLRDGQPQTLPLAAVQVNDEVWVRPGERVPVDGAILDGRSHLDESLLTGESLPVARGPGERVIGGAINGEGLLRIRTTAVGAETALSRIVRQVEQAQARKAPIQKTVDAVSAVFVPAVVGIAALTLLGWGSLNGDWEAAIVHAVSVLVIACPCALGLATPATLMVGTGLAARMGLLVRDAQALELLKGVRLVAFDKTGTLTEGHPRLTDCIPAAGVATQQALRAAAALQAGSEHPLARAVAAAAQAQGLPTPQAAAVQAVAGRGVQGVVDGHATWLGSGGWMHSLGADTTTWAAAEAEQLAQGRTLSWLAQSDGEPGTSPATPRVIALLAFGDAPRAEAAEAVALLKAQGIGCAMLSGDNPQAAAAVAQRVGIEPDQVRAQILPGEKAAAVRAMVRDQQRASSGHRGEAGRVAMVGDGLNDAPALAAADVGIAMAGTDVAMEAAGVTLLRPDLRLVPQAIALSQAVSCRIRLNLFWAFAYNVVGIPLAAGGMLSPVVAGAAMAASSVSVITSALLLKRWRPPRA